VILVTGFPNSGTSFLTNLIVEMGFNPGTRLKGPDNHNRWGYYENLDIRDLTWGAIGGKFDPFLHHTPFDGWGNTKVDLAKKIVEIVKDQGVEIYKDCAAPYLWEVLLDTTHIVVIRRCERDLWKHYSEKDPKDWAYALHRHWELEEKMLTISGYSGYKTRMVWYESFKDVCVVESLYHWLKGEWPDEETLSRLQKVYKPR
jgi:hypothetical protein